MSAPDPPPYDGVHPRQPPPPSSIPRMELRAIPGTVSIAVAIAVGFLVEIATGAWRNEARLAALGAVVPSLFRTHEYWRLITALFLHGDGTYLGDALHLGLNFLALMQLGSLYELMFGTRRFLTIYFIAGIFASVCSAMRMELLQINGAGVGASGAIFGILGAFVFSIRRSPRYSHDPQARFLLPQLVFWILFNIGIGLRVAEIDQSAHLGGLVAGLVMGFFPHKVPPPSPGSAMVEVIPGGSRTTRRRGLRDPSGD